MEKIYRQLQQRSIQIASRYPTPSFYRDFAKEYAISGNFFEHDEIIKQLRQFVVENLEDDFGHGLFHAISVALDAGTILLAEGARMGYNQPTLRRRLQLIQCAGLLHDLKRKKSEHAIASAEAAGEILKEYPFSATECEDIVQAIRNHEAFRMQAGLNTIEGKLLSDCLYDADKFRWGPDNFTSTVWRMVSFMKAPLETFVEHYPQGLAGVAKIKQTFRSEVGKEYGPEFIEIGLAIGMEIYEYITSELQ